MRFRVSDSIRIWRTMNAIMLLIEADPYRAHRISRTRFDYRFRVLGIGVPKEVRVIVKSGVPLHFRNFPISDRQGIVLAADSRRIVRDRFPAGIERLHNAR